MPVPQCKFSEEIAVKLIGFIRGGLPRKVACEKAGICFKTFYNWLARGRGSEEPFAGFLLRVNEAEAELVGRLYKTALSTAMERGDARSIIEIMNRYHVRYQEAQEAEAGTGGSGLTINLQGADGQPLTLGVAPAKPAAEEPDAE